VGNVLIPLIYLLTLFYAFYEGSGELATGVGVASFWGANLVTTFRAPSESFYLGAGLVITFKTSAESSSYGVGLIISIGFSIESSLTGPG
jgi:hypothetical protein